MICVCTFACVRPCVSDTHVYLCMQMHDMEGNTYACLQKRNVCISIHVQTDLNTFRLDEMYFNFFFIQPQLSLQTSLQEKNEAQKE